MTPPHSNMIETLGRVEDLGYWPTHEVLGAYIDGVYPDENMEQQMPEKNTETMTTGDMTDLLNEFIDERNKALMIAEAQYRDRCNVLQGNIEKIMPHKIGDIITIKGTYAHKGKKMRIETAGVVENHREGRGQLIGYAGTILKADGSDSSYEWAVAAKDYEE